MLTAIGPPTEFFVDLQRRVVIPSSFFYWYPLFSIDLALVNDSNLHSSLVDFSQYLGFCLVFVVKVKQSGYTSGPLSSWHTVHGLRGGGPLLSSIQHKSPLLLQLQCVSKFFTYGLIPGIVPSVSSEELHFRCCDSALQSVWTQFFAP